MGMATPFCGEGTPRQAAIMLSVFTLIGCILWLSWSTYQIIDLNDKLSDGDNPCDPNPCLHGGVCFPSEKGDNRLGYVCDCIGTGFEGVHCNASQVRRVSKKSCGEYYVEGHRNDGYYYIDPDGPSSRALDPIRVRCEFRDNKAYTMIEHQYGGVRHFSQHYINDYSGAENTIKVRADYLEYLNYDEKASAGGTATRIQLVKDYLNAIIDQAQHCEQKFVFRCRNWPLTASVSSMSVNTYIIGGVDYLGEILTLSQATNSSAINDSAVTTSTMGPSTTNVPLYYDFNSAALDMAGEVPTMNDPPKCQCHLDNTCEGNGNSNDDHRCNCDNDEETWAEDVATLTKAKHRQYLPIGGVLIGTKGSDGVSDQEAYVELTPLSCYEEYDVIDPFSVHKDGGYGNNGREKYSTWELDGYKIMWGCIIAFMVITSMLLLASFMLLMGVMLHNGGIVVFWLVMVVIMNIMVFILLCVRWYFLGFALVAWELACQFLWIVITFYGMAAVAGFLDNIHARNN